MKRLVLAIVVAILINFILATAIDHLFHMTGVYPPYGEVYFDTDLYLLALGYRILITVFAAYITAMIAKEKADGFVDHRNTRLSALDCRHLGNAGAWSTMVRHSRSCDRSSACAPWRKTLRATNERARFCRKCRMREVKERKHTMREKG